MSESLDGPVEYAAPTKDEEAPEPVAFTLVVVSPSVGVTNPLSFPHLPATTTVKQLKAKIRDALPTKPADETQRLIHRGRMLATETHTMLDIFGQETLANPAPQTIHLVLRPLPTDATSTQIPAPIGRGYPARPILPLPAPQAQQPLPGIQHIQQHHALHHADQAQEMMNQRLEALQREAERLHHEINNVEQRSRALEHLTQGHTQSNQPGSTQLPHLRPGPDFPPNIQNLLAARHRDALIAAQREREAVGSPGTPDFNGLVTPSLGLPSPGRASPGIPRPENTTTYTREGVGPNGERWQVTVNETTTSIPATLAHHHHSHIPGQQPRMNPATDIQAILRNADRYLAAQDAMRRPASNPATPTPASGASSSSFQPTTAPAGIRTAPASASTSPIPPTIPNLAPITNIQTQSTPTPSTTLVDPRVYILSGPTGPRALLINNSETFFTRQVFRSARITSPAQPGAPGPAGAPPAGLPEFRNRPPHRAAPARRPGHRHRNDNAPNNPAVIHPGNPGAGAVAAQLWPTVWLVVRLLGFVWFFTAGNPSWSRWFMVSGLAVIVFFVHTGLFNGIGEQIWGPIRRHLEALIPLAGPEAALVPAANAVAIPQARNGEGEGGEPTPAQAAARLIEERRRVNGGWLMAQIRRAEHSLLLFLASLVPGVGERHIAAREAEATAAERERQRIIDEAAATEAANNQPAAEGSSTAPATEEAPVQEGGENQAQNAEPPVAPAAPVQPLIDV
ncbi:hypothetical protein B7494_g5989 [Chlorociboria aeruginascens]|nr:hypothetical protein B7494_g5989 [Chlorociboria aeruginascens]